MMPTIAERARQMLAKLALEPEWEAKFEPNSYGFRPGRSCHDAIEMIFTAITTNPNLCMTPTSKAVSITSTRKPSYANCARTPR